MPEHVHAAVGDRQVTCLCGWTCFDLLESGALRCRSCRALWRPGARVQPEPAP